VQCSHADPEAWFRPTRGAPPVMYAQSHLLPKSSSSRCTGTPCGRSASSLSKSPRSKWIDIVAACFAHPSGPRCPRSFLTSLSAGLGWAKRLIVATRTFKQRAGALGLEAVPLAVTLLFLRRRLFFCFLPCAATPPAGCAAGGSFILGLDMCSRAGRHTSLSLASPTTSTRHPRSRPTTVATHRRYYTS
jgi:hypothetical protein